VIFTVEQMEQIGRAVSHAVDRLLPPDWDCPYPLVGAVNVRLPFEEDPS
jgi:hypothetical protein